jgi:predicted peptidase
MSEVNADAPANATWDRAAIADQKWWFSLRQKLGMPLYGTLVQKPPGYDHDTAKRWPLILYLHGSGERGHHIKDLYRNGLPAYVEHHKDFPFVVVSPQCPVDELFNVWEVKALLDQALKDYRIDDRRIYLTGLSMGGYGAWMTACTFPDRFAAVAPIAGAAEPADILDLKDMPMWVFHGLKDVNVPIDHDNRCVAALKAIGSQVRYTVYPDLAHDCWTRTYANEELYRWFLQHELHAK